MRVPDQYSLFYKFGISPINLSHVYRPAQPLHPECKVAFTQVKKSLHPGEKSLKKVKNSLKREK